MLCNKIFYSPLVSNPAFHSPEEKTMRKKFSLATATTAGAVESAIDYNLTTATVPAFTSLGFAKPAATARANK